MVAVKNNQLKLRSRRNVAPKEPIKSVYEMINAVFNVDQDTEDKMSRVIEENKRFLQSMVTKFCNELPEETTRTQLATSIRWFHKSVRTWRRKSRQWTRSYSNECSFCDIQNHTHIAETEFHLLHECPGTRPFVQEFIKTVSDRLSLATRQQLQFKHLWTRLHSSDVVPRDGMLVYWLIMGYEPAQLTQVLLFQEKQNPHFSDAKALRVFLMAALSILTKKIRASKDRFDGIAFQRDLQN